MIRINLISKSKHGGSSSTGQAAIVQLVVILAIAFGGGLVGTYLVYADFQARISRAQIKVGAEQAAVKKLKYVRKKEAELKAVRNLVKKKLGVITKLSKGKQGPVRVLDELSVKIPKEVWITSFQQKKNNGVVITGQANTHKWVGIFLTLLEKSKFFTKVSLGYTQIVKIQGDQGTTTITRTRFSLTCKANFKHAIEI